MRKRRGLLRARLRKWLIVLSLLVALLGAAFFWLRDSSLVAVNAVEVSGARGPGSTALTGALKAAAAGMTTLHIDRDELDRVAERFPNVRTVRATPVYPRKLKLRVVEYRPVALVSTQSGAAVAVAADGKLLRGTRFSRRQLPRIRLSGAVRGDRVTGRTARASVALLAQAPPFFERKIKAVFVGPRGLTAALVDGPRLYFGNGSSPKRQWLVAKRLLADLGVRAATYVELSAPTRPAVAGGTLGNSAADPMLAPQGTAPGNAGQVAPQSSPPLAQTPQPGAAAQQQTAQPPQQAPPSAAAQSKAPPAAKTPQAKPPSTPVVPHKQPTTSPTPSGQGSMPSPQPKPSTSSATTGGATAEP